MRENVEERVARSDFGFSHRLRVRWAEVDRQGIVFNGHYLTYFDVGVTEYYRVIGHPYPDDLVASGSDLFAKRAEIEYHASAGYDDLLDVCVRVAKLGNSSFQFAIEIYRGDDLLVSGALVYVNADALSRRSKPLPQFLREAIRRFETTAPVESADCSRSQPR
ncbi:MAG: acyl-CoA thioesterase [Burkholderiales bacterium]